MGRIHWAWVPEDNENRLAEFRTQAGLTIAGLSERIGVSWRSVRDVELCGRPPMCRSGRVKPWVAAACKELQRSIEEVFPHEFCAIRSEAIVEEQYPGIFRRQDEAAIEDIIDARSAMRYLGRTNKRMARVVMLRSNGYTLEDVSAMMGVSSGRVKQLEAKGLRKIREWLREK